ncbi:MAG: MBL fold metallo-hydrolase [Desulfarculus sp.]|nr:MBL fold metallo-hydrolase [Desulfarculus sp.]
MKITCLGAARTVTGSSYLVEKDDDSCFLVDCGLFQGSRQIERRNWLGTVYRPKDLEAIIITHAHIDHSGLTPRVVRLGYNQPIHATEATCELLRILWLDSAHIQEMEAEWQSRKNKRQGKRGVEPLYETRDAEAAIALLRPLDMDKEYALLPGVRAHFVGAGHILGAASLLLTISGKGGCHRVGFSGDLGRPGQLILPEADDLPKPDTLFMETTYGGRTHKTLDDSQRELVAVVKEAYASGGKVIIPAFAVERTQELLYTLAAASRAGELPEDMPVYLDSPLAIAATEIFRRHPELFDAEALELLNNGHKPFDFPNLKFTPSSEDSRAINEFQGPAVIIAGNGMASAGRVKHHLKHNLWRPDCHVVIVGFQAQGTPGRLLIDGAQKIRIFREDVAVKAKVHTIGGFSAHADQNELLSWLGALAHPGLKVNLMHGEETSAMAFRRVAGERYPGVHFHLPHWNESLELKPLHPEGEAPCQPASGDDLTRRARLAQERLASLASRWQQEGSPADASSLEALERALSALEEQPSPEKAR